MVDIICGIIVLICNKEYKNKLEVCARAIIIARGKILVCWHKLKKYYFFPGGHVDFGEAAELAIFRLVKIHRGAIAQPRKLKPQIPEIGQDGIPIRDEIELEYIFE